MIGKTFMHYRVIEKIGQPGMGVVYLAHDSLLNRKVAVKVLPVSLNKDETAHKRFVRAIECGEDTYLLAPADFKSFVSAVGRHISLE